MSRFDKAQLVAEIAGEYDAAAARAVTLGPQYTAFRREHGEAARALFGVLIGHAVQYASGVAGDDNAKWMMAMRSAAFELQEATVFVVASMRDALREPFSPAAIALVAYDVADQARDSWSTNPINTDQMKAQWPAAIEAGAWVGTGEDAEISAIDATLAEAGLDPVRIPMLTPGEEMYFVDVGVQRIGQERVRQVEAEGWTAKHDDAYADHELRRAAQGYLSAVEERAEGVSEGVIGSDPPDDWPWAEDWWKPKSGIRDLERAGALIAAEIGRRLRQHDAFLALVVDACVAGGCDRGYAIAEVAQVVTDHLKEEGIEVGLPNYDWGVSGAADLADELVLRHAEGEGA